MNIVKSHSVLKIIEDPDWIFPLVGVGTFLVIAFIVILLINKKKRS